MVKYHSRIAAWKNNPLDLYIVHCLDLNDYQFSFITSTSLLVTTDYSTDHAWEYSHYFELLNVA